MINPPDLPVAILAGPNGPVDENHFELTLYVSGASGIAARAIANAKHLCEKHLADYQLAVVDVHDDPAALLNTPVLAIPTMIRSLPLPARRVVGDFSDTARVVAALGFPVAELAHREQD